MHGVYAESLCSAAVAEGVVDEVYLFWLDVHGVEDGLVYLPVGLHHAELAGEEDVVEVVVDGVVAYVEEVVEGVSPVYEVGIGEYGGAEASLSQCAYEPQLWCVDAGEELVPRPAYLVVGGLAYVVYSVVVEVCRLSACGEAELFGGPSEFYLVEEVFAAVFVDV